MTPGYGLTAEDVQIEARVEFARVEAAYKQTPFTLAMAVVFSCALFGALHPIFPTPKLYIWLIANNLVTLVRYALIRLYLAQPPQRRAHSAWKHGFVLGTFVAGIVWGLLGTMLYPPHGDPAQTIVNASLIAVCAVALFSLSILFEAFLALILPVLIPSAVSMALSGFYEERVMAAILLLFLVIAAVNGRRNSRNVSENLRLRFQLARAADESQAASRAKSLFLASVSHEIRTPMNGILGIAHLMRSQVKNQAMHRHLDLLYGAGEQLLGLINDILDFSKIEAGRLKLHNTDFDFRVKVHEVTDVLAERARQAGLRFTLHIDDEIPRLIHGDPVRIQQMLNNLVGNAIKFTKQGFVTLAIKKLSNGQRCRLEDEQALCIDFAVADTGIGIGADDQKRIFDAFSQVDNSFSRAYPGTGLGLAICLELADLMGGSLTVQSELGKGSTFSFTAVLAPSTVRGNGVLAEAPTGYEEQGTQLFGSVLLVEDTPINQVIAQATLEEMGLDVAVAADGETAFEMARQHAYDLILMDVFLPVVDGYEATRRIRAANIRRPAGDAVPIVAVTANASQEDKERCLAAGMDDYLAKPYRQQQLFDALSRWLPRRSRQPLPESARPAAVSAPLSPEHIEQMFRQSSARLMEDLRVAMEQGDMQSVERHAHSLKSASAHVDARELSWACRTLEDAAGTNNAAVAATTVTEVTTLYKAVLESMCAREDGMAVATNGLRNPSSLPAQGCQTVLVVDDLPDDLLLLSRILEKMGYVTRACSSGEAALEICRSSMPDIVVLDGKMPGLGGIETCRALRRFAHGKDVPIIFVSGNEGREWEEAAYSAGADSVIKKALSMDELNATLSQAIRRACAAAEQRRSSRPAA